MPKIRNLAKLPKRKVTVDDLLDRQGFADVIDEIIEDKDNMSCLLGIWITQDGKLCWHGTHMSKAYMVYLLDITKADLLDWDKTCEEGE